MKRTWAKYDSVPKHDIVWTWAARDATGRVARKPFEVTDKTPPTIRRLDPDKVSIMISC